MGLAKTNREIKEQRRREREALVERRKTIPIRVFKALLGAVLLPFILTLWIMADCYQGNKWPWRIG